MFCTLSLVCVHMHAHAYVFVFIPRKVSRTTHTYLSETELREEAGTSDIVGGIRAGLAVQLKQVSNRSQPWQQFGGNYTSFLS